MKLRIILFTLLLFTQSLAALGSIRAASVTEWNFVVFMCADNNLADYLYHIQDINEMEVVGSTERMNIFVLLDTRGDNDTVLYKIKKDYAGKDATIRSPIIERLGEVDFSDPFALRGILEDILEKYPSRHLAVDFWGHGAFYKGVFDDKGKLLPLDKIEDIFENVKADVIIFDACRMGSVETLYAIRNICNYAVAAENDIVGDGLPYDLVFENLNGVGKLNPEIFAKIIVDSYRRWLNDNPVAKSCVMASYNITKFSEDFEKFRNYIKSLNESLPLLTDTLKNSLKNTESYEAMTNGDLIDLLENIINSGDVHLKKISEKFITIVESWILNYTVYSYGNDVNNAHGLSIYTPKLVVDPYYRVCSFSADSGWYFFLKNLYSSECKSFPINVSITVSNFTANMHINENNFTHYEIYISSNDALIYNLSTNSSTVSVYLGNYGKYRIDIYGFINNSLYAHAYKIISITYPIWINGTVIISGVKIKEIYIEINGKIFIVEQHDVFSLKLEGPTDAKIGDNFKIIVFYGGKKYEYIHTIKNTENFVEIKDITENFYLLAFSLALIACVLFPTVAYKKVLARRM